MTDYELLLCLIRFFFGFICYHMANKRGRNKWLGLIGGILFGFGSIIYYWIVGKSKSLIEQEKEEKRKERQEELERLVIILNSNKK